MRPHETKHSRRPIAKQRVTSIMEAHCRFMTHHEISDVPSYEPRGRAFESLRACQKNQALRSIFGLAFLLSGGWGNDQGNSVLLLALVVTLYNGGAASTPGDHRRTPCAAIRKPSARHCSACVNSPVPRTQRRQRYGSNSPRPTAVRSARHGLPATLGNAG